MSAASPARRLRVLLLVTEDWYFWSHRRGLARALLDAGHEVVLATRVGELRSRIEALGVKVVPIGLRRTGRNPAGEVAAIAALARLYRAERPDVVHHVGVKPMLYGSWAARLAGVRAVVNAQAGLGYVFTDPGIRARLMRWFVLAAYRSAWAGAGTRVVFQNADNLEYFCGSGILDRARAVLVRGVGVDLGEFAVRPEPGGVPVVMLASRLLWDKGIGETVEAARRIRAAGTALRLVLVGRPDAANPRAIDEAELRRWEAAGDVEWWGHRADMPEAIAGCTVFVLPSYAEGLPKVLVEAAAVGRAVVTTDVPGCRDVVRDGVNGLLVPPRDPAALAAAIARLVGDPEERGRMAAAGRRIAEQEFCADRIAETLVALFEEVAGARGD